MDNFNETETMEPEVALVPAEAEDDDPYIVKLTKPYPFDDVIYTELDLSGLEEMNTMDMRAAEKHLNRKGVFSPTPELSAEYVCFVAAKALKQPIEFFDKFPPKDFIKVKAKVTNFFYGEV